MKAHIVLLTNYRKQLLKDNIADDVKRKIFDICNSHNWEIIAVEADKDHIHFLLSYDTIDRVCDIVKTKNKKQLIIFGTDITIFLSNSIGRNASFGLMVILIVALEKYHQLLFESTLKAKGNG